MKILHIIPSLIKGGAQRMALNICHELAICSKFDVQLVTFRPENNYSFLTKGLNWEVIPSEVIPSILKESIVEIEELQQFITAFEPDIIHSHLFETEMVLAHISFPVKTKRIIHFHDNMVQMHNFNLNTLLKRRYLTNFFEKRIVLQSYPTNTKAIAISQNTFDFCKSVLPRKIAVELLHNAIDLTVFKNKQTMTNSLNITLIGGLVENKGHHLAFQAIHTLKKRGLKLKLFCLGEGSERIKLEALILELDLTNEVELLGNQDHPELFLQNSFCYLSTSKSEAFGLTIIEAMACGLPVVCTDGKGNRDLIREGENGFLVWERDPKLIADKIEALIKNDRMRIEMGNNARVFSEEFGIIDYIKNLINIYSEKGLKTTPTK